MSSKSKKDIKAKSLILKGGKEPLKKHQKLPKLNEKIFKDGSFWGLDTIDRKRDGNYYYDYTGANVNVYILDSGLTLVHPGLMSTDQRKVEVIWSFDNRTDIQDCNGHGSHVAGIIGGKFTGVAKNANLFMLRIAACEKTFNNDNIIAALEYLKDKVKFPAILNFSFGSLEVPTPTPTITTTGSSPTATNSNPSNEMKAKQEKLDPSTKALMQLLKYYVDVLKVPIIVAAGNGETDECDPIFNEDLNLIVVGAASSETEVASFSNYGQCVHFYAPGAGIVSLSNNTNPKDELYTVLSGTSQAAPFVTGVASLLMEMLNRQLPPEELYDYLMFVSKRQVKVKDRSELYPFVYTPLTQETFDFAVQQAEKQQLLQQQHLLLIVVITLSVIIPIFLFSLMYFILNSRAKKKRQGLKEQNASTF